MVTAYKSAEGVKDAVANFADKTTTITYDSARTSPEELLNVLQGTPYSAYKHEDNGAAIEKK